MSDYIGKFPRDKQGNLIPEHQDLLVWFIHHDGERIWVQAPGAGVSDCLTFSHAAGTAKDWINRHYTGQKVRIHSKLEYNPVVGQYYLFHTLHGVSIHSI